MYSIVNKSETNSDSHSQFLHEHVRHYQSLKILTISIIMWLKIVKLWISINCLKYERLIAPLLDFTYD